MKKFKLNFLKSFWILLPLFLAAIMVSCGDDEDPIVTPDNPVASFQFEISEDNFLTVTFTNFSQNATSYNWDFGDGNSSTDESPTHTYGAAGDYTINLTATNSAGSAMRSEMITITDPNAALKLLTGDVSKTWKLFREGVCMSLWNNQAMETNFWPGLTNDGSRPCLYEQEITFGLDGSYTFNDNGMFWAEFGVFNNVDGCDVNITAEQCFEATAANLVNACGDDVSAWASGTHTFTYDAATGELSLAGMGAWIGIPKLGTSGETIVPVSSVSAQISIEEFTGYDLLLVEFIYDGTYWPITYASYSDASLEPEVVTEQEEFGEDLPDVSPAALGHSFMEAGTSTLDTIPSGSGIEFGAVDPADAAATCGLFTRTDAMFQELQFQTSPEKNDVNFMNLTTASIDVYFPSTNDYSGTLTRNVIIGLADASKTEQWWTDHQQYEQDGTDLATDEWITVTFDLDSPSFVANPDNGSTPYDRNDYDMFFVQIGSGAHTATGTFYVRNLRFE